MSKSCTRRSPETMTQSTATSWREGLIPPESFFNPDNMQRILAGAGAAVR
jgi:hypothetical protein